MTDVPQPASPAALVYSRRPGLARLVLKNLFLNVVTLWIYRFWAKAAWRRHIWGNASLNGDPIEYTGTGKDAYLRAFAGLAVFLLAAAMVIAVQRFFELAGIAAWGWYIGCLYIASVVAAFDARRHWVSRLRWRGANVVLEAGLGAYLLVFGRLFALNAITLFVFAPRFAAARETWLLERTRIGGVELRCAPDWRRAMKPWLAFFVSSVVVMLSVLPGAWTSVSGFPPSPPFGSAPGWIVVAAIAAAISCFVAYKVALFRTIVAGTCLGDVAFTSRASTNSVVGYVWVGVATSLALVLAPYATARLSVTHLGVPGYYSVAAMPEFLAFEVLFFYSIGLSFLHFWSVLVVLLYLWLVALPIFVFVRDLWLHPKTFEHLVRTMEISRPNPIDGMIPASSNAPIGGSRDG